MLRGIRVHLTYANVIATAALFIALGGVGYAAVKVPKNSVGTAQLKKNAVTGSKIRSNAVGNSDLSPVVRAQLARAGTPGPAGPAGAKGEAGAKGDAGSPGLSGYAQVEQTLNVQPASNGAASTLTCPQGTVVLGGGYEITGSNNVLVTASEPVEGVPTTQWIVVIQPLSGLTFGTPATVFTRAQCAKVAP